MQLCKPLILSALALLLIACGGGGGSNSPPAPTYTISGNVTGLTGTLVLANNGGNSKSVSAAGGFTFTTALATGAAYAVTILTQPAGQTCAVSMGSGTIAAANVTTVAVACATSVLVTGVADAPGGAVAGATVTLKDSKNASANATTASDGTFSIDVTFLTGPFLLSVASGGQTLFGYADAGGGVANLTPYTTAALAAYYLSLKTDPATVFAGTVSGTALPDPQELNLISFTIWAYVVPYLTLANAPNAPAIDPFRTPFTANHTGESQLIDRTVVTLPTPATAAVTLTFDSGSGNTAGSMRTTATFKPGPPQGDTSGVPPIDLATVTGFEENATNPAGTTTTSVLDLCRTHGTPITGAGPPFDCVASMRVAPAGINIALGASTILEENTVARDQIHTTLLPLDAAGYGTTVPNYNLTWTNSDTSVIGAVPAPLTGGGTINFPQVTTANLGSAILTLTDPVTKVSTPWRINVISALVVLPLDNLIGIPVTESPIVVQVGQMRQAYLTDGTLPVRVPAVLAASSNTHVADLTLITVCDGDFYNDDHGVCVEGNAPGQSTLTFSGTFGLVGELQFMGLVCVPESNNASCAQLLQLPSSVSALPNSTVQLTPVEADSTGASVTPDPTQLVWSASGPGCSVSSTGLVTVPAAGSCTITVVDNGANASGNSTPLSATTTVTVSSATLALTPADPSVTAGASVQLTATETAANGTGLTPGPLTWSSSNAAVAVSATGLVTASPSSTGSSLITAVDNSDQATGTTTVSIIQGGTFSGTYSVPAGTGITSTGMSVNLPADSGTFSGVYNSSDQVTSITLSSTAISGLNGTFTGNAASGIALPGAFTPNVNNLKNTCNGACADTFQNPEWAVNGAGSSCLVLESPGGGIVPQISGTCTFTIH
jgi:hypothetical protein